MKYMCLIYSSENDGPAPGTPEFGPYMKAYQDFTARVQENGVYIAGDALQPAVTATTVTTASGKPETMDGPFAETKEQLGGYYLLECANIDDALKYAAMIPTAAHGHIEVRPLMVFD
ncbi:MAG: YciI family protein [Hyphomonadaceae bacterium]